MDLSLAVLCIDLIVWRIGLIAHSIVVRWIDWKTKSIGTRIVIVTVTGNDPLLKVPKFIEARPLPCLLSHPMEPIRDILLLSCIVGLCSYSLVAAPEKAAGSIASGTVKAR